MRITLITLFTVFSFSLFAQIPSYEIWFDRSIPNEGRAVPDRFIREANVKMSKRIHRVIDTRFKQNKDMTWPKNPFIDIVMLSATKGLGEFTKIPAYESESLDSLLTPADILAKMSYELSYQKDDPANPGNMIDVTDTVPIELTDIIKFRIMEDWIFDANYSDFRPRIIAIAPVYNIPTATFIDLGEAELFWVKMSDLQPIIAQQEIFNKHNNAAMLSYNHWFTMRMFDSYIVKESNVYDTDLKYYEELRDDGIAALLESDKIKNNLFILEHDLWEY
jgi:gliding motility associated protien GldN